MNSLSTKILVALLTASISTFGSLVHDLRLLFARVRWTDNRQLNGTAE